MPIFEAQLPTALATYRRVVSVLCFSGWSDYLLRADGSSQQQLKLYLFSLSSGFHFYLLPHNPFCKLPRTNVTVQPEPIGRYK